MKLPLITRWITTRRALRSLDRIATALDRQTILLARLADHVAPLQPPEPDPDDLRRAHSVDSIDLPELLLVQAYSEKMRNQTGHEPSDEEILQFLADESTQALHSRMTERG